MERQGKLKRLEKFLNKFQPVKITIQPNQYYENLEFSNKLFNVIKPDKSYGIYKFNNLIYTKINKVTNTITNTVTDLINFDDKNVNNIFINNRFTNIPNKEYLKDKYFYIFTDRITFDAMDVIVKIVKNFFLTYGDIFTNVNQEITSNDIYIFFKKISDKISSTEIDITFDKYIFPLLDIYDIYGDIWKIGTYTYGKILGSSTGNVECANNNILCFLGTLFRDMIILEAIEEKNIRQEPNIYYSALTVADISGSFKTLNFLSQVYNFFQSNVNVDVYIPLTIKLISPYNDSYVIENHEKDYILGIFYIIKNISDIRILYNDNTIDFSSIFSVNILNKKNDGNLLGFYNYFINMDDFSFFTFTNINFLQGIQDTCNIFGLKSDFYVKKVFKMLDNVNHQEIFIAYSSAPRIPTNINDIPIDSELDILFDDEKEQKLKTTKIEIIQSKNIFNLVSTNTIFRQYNKMLIDIYFEKAQIKNILKRATNQMKSLNENDIKILFKDGELKNIKDKLCKSEKEKINPDEAKNKIKNYLMKILNTLKNNNNNKDLINLNDNEKKELINLQNKNGLIYGDVMKEINGDQSINKQHLKTMNEYIDSIKGIVLKKEKKEKKEQQLPLPAANLPISSSSSSGN